MTENSPGATYLQTAIKRMKYYKQLGDKTLEQLTDEQLHFEAAEGSNSIATIIQHVGGNMLSRWTNFLTEDGEKEWRNRDTEFEEQQLTRQQLADLWEKGWICFIGALESLTENDLLKTIYIRQEPLIVIDAINRQLAHYPYHVGQIIFIGKMLKAGNWKSLSIEKGKSDEYNRSEGIKDPANHFKK
ncbi:MAG: DUF1572 family protein [Chitinophagaceae bacterium]